MLTRYLTIGLALIIGMGGLAAAPVRAVDTDGDGVDDAVDVCNNTPAGTAVDAQGRPLGDIDVDCDTDLADYALFQSGFTGPLAPFSMALIPAGEFQMGDSFTEGNSDERPVHAVYVDTFYMDRTEVTNQQYADALNWAMNQGNLITVTNNVVYKYNTGTSYPYCDTYPTSSYSRITWNGTTFGVTTGKESHPMVQVSW